MKIKRILCLVTATILSVLILTSCGSSTDVEAVTGANKEEKTVAQTAKEKDDKSAETTKAAEKDGNTNAQTTAADVTTAETTTETEPSAPAKENILPLTIKSGTNSRIDFYLDEDKYYCYLNADNELYGARWKQNPTLLFENVRDFMYSSSNKIVYIIKDDNTMWVFGDNSNDQLGPKAKGEDEDGYVIHLNYYPPENAVKIADNVANFALSYDDIYGYISTDKVFYLHNKDIQFIETDITNVVKSRSGTMIHATGDVYAYPTGEASEGIFLASDVVDFADLSENYAKEGFYSSIYFINTDNQLIIKENDEISIEAEDVVKYFLDYVDGGTVEFILKTDGTLWAKGWNEDGELGDGTKTYQEEYVQVAENVRTMAPNYSVYLKNDGTLYTWYDNAVHYAYPGAKFVYLDCVSGRLVDTEGNEWHLELDVFNPYELLQNEVRAHNPEKNLIMPSEEIYNG
jgi:hypothetical protein